MHKCARLHRLFTESGRLILITKRGVRIDRECSMTIMASNATQLSRVSRLLRSITSDVKLVNLHTYVLLF